MLKPVAMKKVRIVCLKKVATPVIRLLHNMAIMQLKNFELPETERAGPLASFDDVAYRAVRIRSMLESFPKSMVPDRKRKVEVENPLKMAKHQMLLM